VDNSNNLHTPLPNSVDPVLPCSLRRSSTSEDPQHWWRWPRWWGRRRRGWSWRRRPSSSSSPPQRWRGWRHRHWQRQQDQRHHYTDNQLGQGWHPPAVLQPLDWYHQHVVGLIQAIGPIQTVARLLRCTADGATVHASYCASASSSRSATSAAVLDTVVRGVGSTVPRRLLQHHKADPPRPPPTGWPTLAPPTKPPRTQVASPLPTPFGFPSPLHCW
jgi:hypothetical protein